MAKSRSDQMVERLRNMQAAAPDIEASAVVSVDGLIMASALQQGVEEDRVSAMSAAMLSLGERISGELGRGSLEQVYIKGEKGAIVLTAIGEEAVLTATKVGGWRIKATKSSFLTKILGSAKGVIVPHNLVSNIGDVMIISRNAVPAFKDEEAAA